MFNEYPYVNLQDVNLDWILKHIKDLETNLQDFVKLNTIKYADPIIWNITKQYETNTVVIDGNTGTAYISVQPVPAGVALTNTDYWTVVFTLNLTTSNQNITFRDDGTNVVATFASDTGDWILWNFYLYRVTQPISVNTAYVEGFNIERFSVELFIRDYINTLAEIIGDLDDLTTSDKTSIVNAIIELVSNIGDLDDLNTTDKTSIVNAINELLINMGDLNDLDTTDKTSIVNSINELVATRTKYVPYITGTFTDVAIGENISVGGYFSENDGGGGIWQRVNAAITDITYDHLGAYYKPVAINGFVNVKQFGVIGNRNDDPTVKSDNMTIINAVIAASEYEGLIIPSDVNYGYNSHAVSRNVIDTSTSTIKLLIYDYSIDDSYPGQPLTEGAAVCRMTMHTPDPNGTGQHDGNGLYIIGNTNPYIAIVNDNTTGNEQRAGLFFGSRDYTNGNHLHNWQIGQSYWAGDHVLHITKWVLDENNNPTTYNYVSFDYANDLMVFGNTGTAAFPFELNGRHVTQIEDFDNQQVELFHWRDKHPNPTHRFTIKYMDDDRVLIQNQNGTQVTITGDGNVICNGGVSGGYGASSDRPANAAIGTMYLDTTVHKPIWKYNASTWVDATGTPV